MDTRIAYAVVLDAPALERAAVRSLTPRSDLQAYAAFCLATPSTDTEVTPHLSERFQAARTAAARRIRAFTTIVSLVVARPELPDGPVILSVDAAFKTGTGNDYSVIQAWQRGESAYYLVDQWRQRVEYPELRRAVELEAMKHRATAVYIEDAAAGQSVIQELRRNTRLPIIPVRPEGSKEARADAASPLFEAGKVVLPSHAAWVDALIDELTVFPNGTHDDQVDAATQALRNMGKVSTTRTFDLEFRQSTTAPVPIPSGLGFNEKIRALSAERRRGRLAGPVGIGSVRIGR